MTDLKRLGLKLEAMAARAQKAIDQEHAQDDRAGMWQPVGLSVHELAEITGLAVATARKYATQLVESGAFARYGDRWTTAAERRRFQIADRARVVAALLKEGGEPHTRDGLVSQALKLQEGVWLTLGEVCHVIERPACEVDAVAVDRLRDMLAAIQVRLLEGCARALIGTASGLEDPEAHRKLREEGRAFSARATLLEKAL